MKYILLGGGGIGMSSIGHILLDLGEEVVAIDKSCSSPFKRLKERGAVCFTEGESVPISKDDTVVYSTAISVDNRYRIESVNAGALLIHRAKCLERLFKDKKSIVVTGSHGKTSVTALIIHILERCGMHPSYSIGGERFNQDNGKYTQTCVAVIEGDESDGSLIEYRPDVCVITNCEYEHVEFHDSLESIQKDMRHLLKHSKKGVLNTSLDYMSRENDIVYDSSIGVPIDTSMFYGSHVLENVSCAIHSVLALYPLMTIPSSVFEGYSGVQRRFEEKGSFRGVPWYDDYAHHPTEVAATLDMMSKKFSCERVLCIFQPHKHERFSYFYKEFYESLLKVKTCIITDCALSTCQQKKLHEPFFKYFLANRSFSYCERGILAHYIYEQTNIAQDYDVILTLGAGDINHLLNEVSSFE